ncbi:hypothetical protein AB6E09_22630 [Vibrio lentus]
MTQIEHDLLPYLVNFIVRIKEDRIRFEQISPEVTFEELDMESMDFVELQVVLLDDYGIDIFACMPRDLKTMSLAAFSKHLLEESLS